MLREPSRKHWATVQIEVPARLEHKTDSVHNFINKRTQFNFPLKRIQIEKKNSKEENHTTNPQYQSNQIESKQ